MALLAGTRATFVVVAALALFASAAGCRHRSLDGSPWRGPTDARPPVADAGADLGAWAGGPPDAVGADAVVPDGPPPSPVRVFENVVSSEEALRRGRWVECFGASPTVIAGWNLVELVGDGRAVAALSAGRAVVDPAKADACLTTIARATCPEIAAGATDRACVDLLAGKVPPNGACRADFECAASAQGAYRCEGDVRAACGGRCTPRPRTGEACGDVECALGTTCQRVDGGVEQCVKVSLAGAPCKTADGCGVNDYCRWRTPYDRLEGTCQPRVSGALCEGRWECPYPYACVAAAGDGAGHCQVGLPVGEPCRVYGHDAIGGPYHDCAITLSCLPSPDGAWRCSEGTATGEACGNLWSDAGVSTNIPCRNGGCVFASQSDSLGICRPFAPLGGPCAADEDCGARRACLSGVCVAAVPSSFPIGARCPLGICADGARCEPSGGPTADTACVAPTADGQPCRGDAMCGPNFSKCQGGFCTPCP